MWGGVFLCCERVMTEKEVKKKISPGEMCLFHSLAGTGGETDISTTELDSFVCVRKTVSYLFNSFFFGVVVN